MPEFLAQFNDIVKAHYPGLYRFALSMCRSDATARDLVQQTFLQWARHGRDLKDSTKVKSWLFTTLYREWLRVSVGYRKFDSVEFEPELHGLPPQEEITLPPRIDSQTIHLALDQMDERHRAPLVLFFLQEMSYKDIAAALDIPIGTVMSRISRAKQSLRDILVRLESPDVNPGDKFPP